MNITTNFLDKNKYSRPGTKRNKTTKIAWHYVGNPGSSAKANRNYFNNAPKHKTSASSHYIIGLEGEIIYCVPEDEIAYTTNSANSYSIGIEMCHPDSSGKFNSLTYNSAVELGVDLAKGYKLNPLTDFIRHYDVTKKCCPKYWVDNKSAWEKFKQDVNNKLKVDNTQGLSTVTFKNGDYTGKKARVTANVLNVRYDRGTQYNVIGKLNKGDIVKLNYCLNGWISIEGYKGNKGLGYVSTEYLELI